jgi:hypothetical protein
MTVPGTIMSTVPDVFQTHSTGRLPLSPKEGHWQDNPEVEALVKDVRSTTFGDRIVSPDGLAYSIHNFSGVGAGFMSADPPDLKARFSEILKSKQGRQVGERSESLERGREM